MVVVVVIGCRLLLLSLPDRGEKNEEDEEEDSSPTGDETGSRRGLLSWLWVACPWRAGEMEDILGWVGVSAQKRSPSIFGGILLVLSIVRCLCYVEGKGKETRVSLSKHVEAVERGQ